MCQTRPFPRCAADVPAPAFAAGQDGLCPVRSAYFLMTYAILWNVRVARGSIHAGGESHAIS
jgi:hypothetical protein